MSNTSELTLLDYKGHLNFETFGEDFNKGITEVEFNDRFPKERFEVYTEKALQAYTMSVRKKIMEIQKAEGEDEDTIEKARTKGAKDKVKRKRKDRHSEAWDKANEDYESGVEELAVKYNNKKDWQYTKAGHKDMIELWNKRADEHNRIAGERGGHPRPKKSDISKAFLANIQFLQRVIRLNEAGGHDVLFVKAKDIKKSIEDTIEKGLSDTLRYNSDMSVTKTGKEVREKVASAITIIKEKIVKTKERMEVIVDEVGEQPTEKPWFNSEDNPMSKDYRTYNYNKTCYNCDKATVNQGSVAAYSETAGKSISGASSEDQAKLCSEYNQLVSKCYSMCNDLEIAEVFLRNFDDKKSYKLNIQQLKEFGF